MPRLFLVYCSCSSSGRRASASRRRSFVSRAWACKARSETGSYDMRRYRGQYEVLHGFIIRASGCRESYTTSGSGLLPTTCPACTELPFSNDENAHTLFPNPENLKCHGPVALACIMPWMLAIVEGSPCKGSCKVSS